MLNLTSHQIIFWSSIVIAIMSLYLLSKASDNEHFAAYPFSPQDPSNPNYSVFDPQSVYGQFGDKFGLTHNPDTIDEGAFRSLEIMDNRARVANNMYFEHDWKLNDGFNNSGNTQWGLSLSEKPFQFWDYL
jgi:hypothetical protein